MKVTNDYLPRVSQKARHSAAVARHTASSKPKAKASSRTKSKPKAKAQSRKSGGLRSFFRAMSSRRAVQLYGILLMTFALLLLLSILWFYFDPDGNLSHVDSGTPPHNIGGTVGSYLSYYFLKFSFGIFAVGFPFLFSLYGLRLTFGKSPLPLCKTTVTALLSMAWLSLLAGLFCRDGSHEFIAGTFGNYLAALMLARTGKLVTTLAMFVLLAAILILCYGMNPKIIHVRRPVKDHGNPDNNSPAPDGNDSTDDDDETAGMSLFGRLRRKKKDVGPPARHEELPSLYIENRQGITGEYKGNVYEFDQDDTAVPEATPARTGTQTGGQPERQLGRQPEKAAVTTGPGIRMTTETELENFESDRGLTAAAAAEKEADFEIIDNTPRGGQDDTETATDDEDSPEETEKAEKTEALAETEPYDPRKELSHYQFPTTDLLSDHPVEEKSAEQIKTELIEKKKQIESTLGSFKIKIKKISATVGPTVTLYEIIPAEGIRISKIKNLEDDIALSLAALGIRIIAPIPGRGTIGIEVPNRKPAIVSMREVINSDRFQNNKYELPIGIGKTISNEPFVVDLAKMPHLLIAGATGQGKSVGLNAVITSLLYKKHPGELKFVLIDPKKVEFTLYSAIENYYLAKLPDSGEAIITDTKKVVRTLNALCKEMDMRYDLLKLAKTRNIKEYNAKFCSRSLSPVSGHRYLPYIVLVIDEFGDLIMTAGREVETPLARLAQLARAIGIHLVIATQRPSVNIITGIIKANFPARIAFRVSSGTDSRTILDCGGADQLIGRGDMLISTGSDLIRLQCAFVDTPEVEKIVNFIEEQSAVSPLSEPFELPDVPEDGGVGSGNGNDTDASGPDEFDPLLPDAANLLVQLQQGSTSSIQRHMKLGYNRAGRIMDQLEELGVVGPSNGSKARDVLVKTEMELHELLARKGFF